MATTFTDTLFATEYKDDFSDSAGFYRILYNGGKVLQSRELTQMQTIINKQIERFGNNIFKEGAVVKAGGFALDAAYEFVKLDTTSTSTSANVGDIITGATSGIRAEILEIVAAASGDPVTYYVRYVNTTSIISGVTTPRFTPGEGLGSGRIVQITNTSINPAIGRGARVTVGESIYFTQGFFVYTEPQAYTISKYSDAPNSDVGFKIVQDVVSENDDVSLYDNSTTNPNLTAPGAHRFRIKLYLTDRASLGANENFIHVATIKDGAIFAAVKTQQDLQYNIPRDLIAKRIHENSGNYLVKPFRLQFVGDSQDTHLVAKISDGIAIVDGYRAARLAPSDIRIAKPTITIENEGEFTAIDYGNYVDVLADSAIGGPSLTNYPRQNLMDAKDFGGSRIGYGRVRGVHENGENMRYHLFDIKMDAGKSFRNVKSIGLDSDNFLNPLQTGTNTILEDPLNTSLIYPLPYRRPRSIDPQSLEVQFSRSGTSDGAGNFTVSIPSSYALSNSNDWMFFTDAANGGKLSNGSLGGLTTGSSSTTITGLPSSAPITAYIYATISSPVIRAKTLVQDATITTTITNDSDGNQIIDLGQADIYTVKRIRTDDSDGIDLFPRFRLDNGQRPGFYDIGKLTLQPGQTAPSGNVYVKFDHFNHGNGNFFAINSYTGVIDYGAIPNFVYPNGRRINLRDVLDFRSVKNTSTSFTTADVSPMPAPNELTQSDNTYYLPRAYKLSINKDGNFTVNVGQPNFNPVPPGPAIGELPLYNFTLGGNTINSLDVSSRQIEHKRYTMRDIGRIEDRINNLEEVTSLSLLEMNTNNYAVLDSAGVNRTKSGFFADNFTTHSLSATPSRQYASSIDPFQGILRPSYSDDNIRLIFDSDNSVNSIRRGDNVYMSFTETEVITQPFATKAVKINPFTTSVYQGNMILSPASDDWHDKNVQSKTVIDGGTKLDTTRAYNWNSWNWNWSGRDIEDLYAGAATNTISKTSGRRTTNTVNVIVSDKVIDEVIGERILNVAMLPFIRSRIINIKARGLRPNSNVYLFFAGDQMADYVREEPYVAYSDTTKDYGNTLRGLTEHVDGSAALTTDASGAVNISFQLPNNDTYRYRAGTHEIKIMDASVNQESVSGTIARAIYVAQGYLDTVHQDIKATRMLEVEGNQIVTYRPVVYQGGDGDQQPPPTGTTIGGKTKTPDTVYDAGYDPESWGHVGGTYDDYTQGISGGKHDTVFDAGNDPNSYTPPNSYDPAGTGAKNDGGGTGFGSGTTDGGSSSPYDCYVATALMDAGYWHWMKKTRLVLWCMKTKPEDKLDTKIWRNGYMEFGKKIIAPHVHNKAIQWLSEGFYQSTVGNKKSVQALLGKAFFYIPSYAIGIYKALTGKLVEIDRT